VNISPLGDVVMIRRSSPEEVSAGGIHLVFDADYKEDIGEVVFVGRGKHHRCKYCNCQTNIEMSVKPGDKVIFSTHGHQITKVNGQELVVLREDSIIGVFVE
jgi:chaperonin GroES